MSVDSQGGASAGVGSAGHHSQRYGSTVTLGGATTPPVVLNSPMWTPSSRSFRVVAIAGIGLT
jgi:hypothetical protein